jgi:hypothetical protein
MRILCGKDIIVPLMERKNAYSLKDRMFFMKYI